MRITSKTKLCLIIGDPIEQSASPIMHNAGYESLGIDDKFAFIALNVTKENLKTAIEGFRVSGIRGITCTIPHKEAVIELLDEVDEDARMIGAVNTIRNDNGKLIGYNTDWLGIMRPIENLLTDPKGKKVALIGAGGASRAACFALKKLEMNVVVFNRTLEKAKDLANHFEFEARSLDTIKSLEEFDLIINSTSVGMKDDLSPIDTELLLPKHIVFDNVYKYGGTKLINDAKKHGSTIIEGTEMLLFQGFEQFKIYTGFEAPQKSMRESLMRYLSK